MLNNRTKITAEPGKQELFITREFDAPPEHVFKAFTDSKLIPKWWGPRDLDTEVDEMDPNPGGRWRFVQKDKDGNEFSFHGVYHDITPSRIIETFEFEGLPDAGHVILNTSKLEKLSKNRTRLTVQSVYQSVEDRDGMLESGMEEGIKEGYEQLDELLEKLNDK